jgi:hypothetical protein
MTKTKLEWEKCNLSFESGWRAEGPHLFDIVEVIGKKKLFREFRNNYKFKINTMRKNYNYTLILILLQISCTENKFKLPKQYNCTKLQNQIV